MLQLVRDVIYMRFDDFCNTADLLPFAIDGIQRKTVSNRELAACHIEIEFYRLYSGKQLSSIICEK